MNDNEIDSLNNTEYLQNILTELKENEELELLIEACNELDKGRYLYLSTRKLDEVVDGMVIVEEKTISFDGKDYYFYIAERVKDLD